MATKIFCDSCDKIIAGTYKNGGIAIPYHIVEDSYINAYSDREGNTISGRAVHFDLCNKCSNIIHNAVMEEIKKIKKENVK